MIHLLPGGGVPRVHGARSPVPPRLRLFVTPRSVRDLPTVAAGAYPLRRPTNALPGPCYWLAASGTPMGLRGGCLAVALVRGSVCCYCLGGCSALFVCAWRSRPVRGVGAGSGSCVSRAPPPPLLRSPRCVWRVVTSVCPLPLPAGTPFYAVCAFCELGPVALLLSPACPLYVCALALPRRPHPSPVPGSVWRAHPAWFRLRAPVGPLNAVRAPPHFLPRSQALSGLRLGGGRPSPFPPYLAPHFGLGWR